MKRKVKNLLVVFMTLVMIMTGMTGTNTYVKAAAGAAVKITGDSEHILKPGETSHIQLSMIATDAYIISPDITITAGTGAPFTFSGIKLSKYNGVTVKDIDTNTDTCLEFDVTVKETAKIGNYPIDIAISYKDYQGNEATTPTTLHTTLKVQEEKAPAQLTIGNIELGDSNIGSKTDLSFTVKNEGEITAKNVYLTMDYKDVMEERYTVMNIKIGDLVSGGTNDVTLPVSILSSATTGRKTLVANFTYKTTDGEEIKAPYNISVNLTAVTSETKTPKLSIEDIQYGGSLKPGNDFNLTVALKNIGGASAKNITVAVDDTSVDATGILKGYFTDGITVSDMAKDADKEAKIPLTVSKYATGGLKAIKLIVKYTDETGTAYTLNDTVYVDVAAATTAAGTPNFVVSNVSQSPAQPVAGEKVEISFDLENKSNVDAAKLKIAVQDLSSATFIPMDSEPYQYYEVLKGGDKIHVTIPLIVSDSIPEGLNNVTVKFTYSGGDDSVIIPVKDVQNDLGSNSKPKLIVSKYSTDAEELRAGKTFNFSFDLYNTNSSVAAKNITVTVTQAENVFSVTQGSNSFFINKIEPGETVTETLEMKVKSDATTKTYPIEIVIEYEYDGAKPNPTTGAVGESRTEKLNLQAVENSRPVLDNVMVNTWDGTPVTVGTPATLNLEFYNMGRSPLNNVTVTVEGDFAKADGSMYFIGNVAEGTSTYAQFDVVPNIEGSAKGLLRVTFEDSNGDTVEFTKEFTSDVMPAGTFDPGTAVDPGTGEVFNPGAPMAKQAILPIWLFVIIQVVIFVLFVPVTRKIIISAYKAKLRRKEQEQY